MCPGEGRGRDLDDQKASIFQLVFHLCGLCFVRNDDHSGFVGSLRMSVHYRQAHRRMLLPHPSNWMHQVDRTRQIRNLPSQGYPLGHRSARPTRNTGPHAHGASASSLNAPQSHSTTQSRIWSKVTFCRTTLPQFPHSKVRGPLELIGCPRTTFRITRRPDRA